MLEFNMLYYATEINFNKRITPVVEFLSIKHTTSATAKWSKEFRKLTRWIILSRNTEVQLEIPSNYVLSHSS